MKCLPLFALVSLLFLQSCFRSTRREEVDLSTIQLPPVHILRYDQALFQIPLDQLPDKLASIKAVYPFFLDTDLRDTTKINALKEYITHPRTIDFYNETNRQYPDLTREEKDLTDAFRHVKYYFPDAVIPRTYAYISGGDYEYPVQWVDSVLLIALDNYLGPAFLPYTADGLPLYKVKRMTREFILPGCIAAMIPAWFPVRYPGNTLLDQMVDAGKRVYIIDAMIPGYPGYTKMGYSPEQMEWATRFESHVWAAIIENQMLYTTRGSIIRSLMADGPFSADFSQESPPRLGEYIGWKIVDAYMESHPDVTLKELIGLADAQVILTESHYKPEK